MLHQRCVYVCACILSSISSIKLRGEPTLIKTIERWLIFLRKFSQSLVRGRCGISGERCAALPNCERNSKKKSHPTSHAEIDCIESL